MRLLGQEFAQRVYGGIQDWYDNVETIEDPEHNHRYKFDADEVSPEQAQWIIDNFNIEGMNGNNDRIVMAGIDEDIIPSDERSYYRDYNNEIFLYHENDDGEGFIGRTVDMEMDVLNEDLAANPVPIDNFVDGFTYVVFEYQGQSYATKYFNAEIEGDLIDTSWAPESGMYRIAPVGQERPWNDYMITQEHVAYVARRLEETGQDVPEILQTPVQEPPMTEAERDNAANPQFLQQTR